MRSRVKTNRPLRAVGEVGFACRIIGDAARLFVRASVPAAPENNLLIVFVVVILFKI
jgi:hypothetical protein